MAALRLARLLFPLRRLSLRSRRPFFRLIVKEIGSGVRLRRRRPAALGAARGLDGGALRLSGPLRLRNGALGLA
jgi:hypothetical protein